jgi:hypothetical protein
LPTNVAGTGAHIYRWPYSISRESPHEPALSTSRRSELALHFVRRIGLALRRQESRDPLPVPKREGSSGLGDRGSQIERGGRAMKKGDHVRITVTKPDGTPHPHAGKTGLIAEVFSLVPRVTVLLDRGQELGGTYAVVSSLCVEKVAAGER